MIRQTHSGRKGCLRIRAARVLPIVCGLMLIAHPAWANTHTFAAHPVKWMFFSVFVGVLAGYVLHMGVSRYFPNQALITMAIAAARGKRMTPASFVDEETHAAMVLSADGRILAANGNLVALMGIDTDNIEGRNAADVLPPSLLDGMMIGFDTGLDSSGAFECINTAGERLTVEVHHHKMEFGEQSVVAVTIIDLTETKRRELELATLAFTDPLTGLPNRLALMRRLARLSDDLAEGPDASFAIFLMDLNKFKPINDTYGHAVGDKLLVEVSARIRNATPRNATVARIGGDEFVVVAGPRVNVAAAAVLARQIIDEVSRPVDLGTVVAHVGVSIGIAIAPADSPDVDTLLMGADQAMYKAKKRKRGFAYMQDVLEEPGLADVA